jgi:predicted nuclease of predicted toxin-antitoxin system
MRFKLDENLGSRTARLFPSSGHEVETVAQEKLSGAADARLLQRCIEERRCLITLDLDFADTTRFPPRHTSGIAVLRPPRAASLPVLERLVLHLLAALESMSIAGQLWVVEIDRIRVYGESESPASPGSTTPSTSVSRSS